MVAQVRRLSQQRHVGHAGTLDPIATGVLPLCIGQATRLSSLVVAQHKTYRADVELGVSTDTYDAEGQVTQRTDPSSITREQVEGLLPAFTGPIMQTPPMYSALKHRGKRLYDLARAGIEVERKMRRVEVFRLELVTWQPPCFTIEVECGKGTYLRSLVHDIGQSLGCGAYIRTMVRLKCGPFSIEDSVTLTQLKESARDQRWQDLLHPLEFVLEGWPTATVDRDQERAIQDGQPIALDDAEAEGRCLAYSHDGRLLALLRFLPDRGLWHPHMVFRYGHS